MMLTAKPANSKRVLICGDSFAADWTCKYSGQGWPNLLAQEFRIDNCAQAGVSEYKIWQQIEKSCLGNYDVVIVWHTSPYRIPVEHHPLHQGDCLHGQCDLLYEDVKHAVEQRPDLQPAVKWFEQYFHLPAAEFTHNLICEKIDRHTAWKQSVWHARAVDWKGLYRFNGGLDFSAVWKKHQGLINHFDSEGNQKIFEKFKELINES